MVDLIIIALILGAVFLGLRRGFVRGVIDVLLVLLALIGAVIAYPVVAGLIERIFTVDGPVVNVLGFIVVAFVLQWTLSLVTSLALSPFIGLIRGAKPVRWLDNMFGVIPGLVKGVVIAAAFTLFLTIVPFGRQFDSGFRDSLLGQRFLTGAAEATYWTQERFGLNLTDFTVVTIRDAEGTYRLPYTVTEGLEINVEDEARMLELVNEERQRHGLAPVVFDAELQPVARAHSEEMLRLGYFSHHSPVTGTPGDRLAAAEVQFSVAGENLAYAPSVQIAHRSLMRSEGHRENILSEDFTRLAVGVIESPMGGKMFTQVFAGP